MNKGKIFHASAQEDLQQTRPLFAYVPDKLITATGKLDSTNYRTQRWASINAGANKDAVGSHIFPDMNRPATDEETKEFKKQLQRYLQKALGAPSLDKKPGNSGPQMY